MTAQSNIAYTYTATGSVKTAENDDFRWFWGSDGYVYDKRAGRSIYLQVAGYSKAEGCGSDPAPADVVSAARAFDREIAAENERIEAASAAAETATFDAALTALATIPATARAELDARNADMRRQAAIANEGGEGYVPVAGWADRTGREILARHGLDEAAINRVADAVQQLAR